MQLWREHHLGNKAAQQCVGRVGMLDVHGVPRILHHYHLGVRHLIASALHIPPQGMPVVAAYMAIGYLTVITSHAPLVLQAMGRERLIANLSFASVGVAVIFQYTLIRRFGLWGVVSALAATEATSVMIFGTIAWRATLTPPRSHLSVSREIVD